MQPPAKLLVTVAAGQGEELVSIGKERPLSPKEIKKEKKRQETLKQLRAAQNANWGAPLGKSPSAEGKAKATNFYKLLLGDDYSWTALLRMTDVEHAQDVAAVLVRVFASVGKDLRLVKYCISGDIAETQEEALLLRGSGIKSAVVAQSGFLHGRAYLKAIIGPVLHKLVHKATHSFEIDARRAGSEEEATRNMYSLINVANQVFGALLGSAETMPIVLRRTYDFAQRAVLAKFPHHETRFATSLFFLRLLCPLLASSEEVFCHCKTLPESASRAQVLLAKLLQSVANELPRFGSEDYLQPLNHWVERAIPSVRRFFKVVIGDQSASGSTSGKLKSKLVPNPKSAADMTFLVSFVQANIRMYRSHLEALNATETLRVIGELLPVRSENSPEKAKGARPLSVELQLHRSERTGVFTLYS